MSENDRNMDLEGSFQAGDPDKALRPQLLSDFVGQNEARSNLSVFIDFCCSKESDTATWDYALFHSSPSCM